MADDKKVYYNKNDIIHQTIATNKYLDEDSAKKIVNKLQAAIKSTDDKLTASDAGLYGMIVDNEIQANENYQRLLDKIYDIKEENKKLYIHIITSDIVSLVLWILIFTLYFT